MTLAPSSPEPPLPDASEVPVTFARDDDAAQGPLAGLATGLAVARDEERVLLVAGDMPEPSTVVLRMLLDALAEAPIAALGEPPDDRPRPLPMACVAGPARAAAAGLLAGGERRLRELLRALPLRVVPAAAWAAVDPGLATARDVDRPEDLRPEPPGDLPGPDRGLG